MVNATVDPIIDGYKSLLYIENILRELMIEQLSNLAGHKWYKTRLSADALKSYKLGIEYEKKHDWRGFISFHPIYYIDFPCLRSAIIQKNNWTEVFSKIFENKEHINSELSSIEPIRNAIAHNRIIGEYDHSIVKNVKNYIANSIGEKHASILTAKTTSVVSIDEKIQSLKMAIEHTNKILDESKKINETDTDTIDSIVSDWWFDEDYLGFNLSNIFEYHEIVRWYSSLVREVGDGYKIERLLINKSYNEIFNKSIDDLTTVLDT